MGDSGFQFIWFNNRTRMAFVLGLVLFLGACAGGLPEVETGALPDVAHEALEQVADIDDPWETINRGTFWFNLKVDKYMLRPAAIGYRFVPPGKVQNSVKNLPDNASSPVTFANDLLKGEFKCSGITFGRLVANSTVGVGGLFEVADHIGLPKHKSGFG